MFCTIDPNIPDDCQGTYTPVTYGYSKNAVTQCQGGLNLLPDKPEPRNCPIVQSPGFTNPDNISGDNSSGAIIAIVFIVIGGVIFLVGVALAIFFVIRRKRRLAAAANGGSAGTVVPSASKPKVSASQEGVHNPYSVHLDESE